MASGPTGEEARTAALTRLARCSHANEWSRHEERLEGASRGPNASAVAQNTMQANGVMYSVSHDLLGMRNQVLDGNWQVCTQNIPAGQQVVGDVEGQIDFGVVQLEEWCP